MSRHGYHDDCDNEWASICYRGAVASAIRGKRGQAFLRELRDALDAMPVKRLIAQQLENAAGEVCALGCAGKARGLSMEGIDVTDGEVLGKMFGIAEALAREIEYENDEVWLYGVGGPTAEQRWQHVRTWVDRHIKATGERSER